MMKKWLGLFGMICSSLVLLSCSTDTKPEIEFQVQVNVEGNGTVQIGGEEIVSESDVNNTSTDYPSGTIIELTAVPSDGWTFEQWLGDFSGIENPKTITLNRSATVIAVFGEINPEFAGGTGSELNPLEISTLSQLQAIENYTDSHFIQINNINANDTENWNGGSGFNPIGNIVVKFTGSYDGAGYNISGLTIKRENEDYIGLFGYISNAQLSNINLEKINVSGRETVGGLVGQNDEGEIINSTSEGTVSGNWRVGGLIGYNDIGIIRNSSSTAEVTGSSGGGLLGQGHQGVIDNSFASGSVSGFGTVGGLVGGYTDGKIHNSYASGQVLATENTAGGLAGSIDYVEIDSSYASGAVSGGGNSIGGLIGSIYLGKINRSFSAGNVSGIDHVGGLVGSSDVSEITNSYALGSVEGEAIVGGLVGWNYPDSFISTSYASGMVTGMEIVGGLIGLNAAPVESSYWDSESSNQNAGIGQGPSASGAVTGLTTSQMTSSPAQQNMPEFDWTNVWKTTTGYPALSWQDD